MATVQELKRDFPPCVDATIIYDLNVFIAKSIHEAVVTIFVAIFLVVGIVFLFLQNWRATIIPVIAIPVSIVNAGCCFRVSSERRGAAGSCSTLASRATASAAGFLGGVVAVSSSSETSKAVG